MYLISKFSTSPTICKLKVDLDLDQDLDQDLIINLRLPYMVAHAQYIGTNGSSMQVRNGTTNLEMMVRYLTKMANKGCPGNSTFQVNMVKTTGE